MEETAAFHIQRNKNNNKIKDTYLLRDIKYNNFVEKMAISISLFLLLKIISANINLKNNPF